MLAIYNTVTEWHAETEKEKLDKLESLQSIQEIIARGKRLKYLENVMDLTV